MQVKATGNALPTVTSDGFFDDRDHLGGEAPVVTVATMVPLTAFELVTALYCGSPIGLEFDELAEMSDGEVRQYVGYVIAFQGMSAVHRAAEAELSTVPAAADERAFLALCKERVTSAFGVSQPAPTTRKRAASRSIGARRELARVA